MMFQAAGFIPEEEWEEFINTLKEPLPVTFRITGSRGEASEMRNIIKTEFISDLLGKDEDGKQPVTCLNWYPDELAWQLNSSRQEVRRDPRLEKLKDFLFQETESGNISRQEAVSMIPPLVMDIKPHHKVLDMCAAPGSKTAQIIEYLHRTENGKLPDGFVIANDVDNKRCYLMTHQVKRLQSPCCAIVNHDASVIPKLKYGDGAGDFIYYDRVLCDVPCSGDGTLRKNCDIWDKWTPNNAVSLHTIQSKILKRGLELLCEGGRLVYSTCSLNPIEDEAVVGAMLKKCEGSVELVDASDVVPGLKYTKGINSWKVFVRDCSKSFETFESIPKGSYSHYLPTMFPLPTEESQKLNLDRCMRVLPHQQNTGGFFIAVLQKTTNLPWHKPSTSQATKPENSNETKSQETDDVPKESSEEGTEKNEEGTTGKDDQKPDDNLQAQSGKRKAEDEGTNPKPPKHIAKKMHGYKEDPYIFLEEDDNMWNPIKDFFGIPNDFCKTQVMHRTETGKRRTLYYVASILKDVIQTNKDRVKFINLGIKIFGRSPSPLVPECDFRITQEGLLVMKEYLPARCAVLSNKDMFTLILNDNPHLNDFSTDGKEQLEKITAGSMVFWFKPTESDPHPDCDVVICGWRGKTSVRAFLNQGLKFHYLRLLNLHLAEEYIEKKREKKRQKEREEFGEKSEQGRSSDDITDLQEEESSPQRETTCEDEIMEDIQEEEEIKDDQNEDSMNKDDVVAEETSKISDTDGAVS
ncbi:hypothetical protein FSP39_025437 [Pinctada imbricata]|uniref:tRNA (cytosine(34)-C(5))-methyltransferase n=1 Tax=Pinctada imbricata TaxID=66713 RepID=A0AA88XMC6_PINIB|nr:hypothetical protein FSP39_025437 [Pinctada imbricata]